MNPDLPPEKWDLSQLVGKVKEFIYLLEDLTLAKCRALAWTNSGFPQEQLRNGDLKEGQIEQQRRVVREAERFFILQQIDIWREHLQAMDALRESWACAAMARKIT